jgi:hypothetical protein
MKQADDDSFLLVGCPASAILTLVRERWPSGFEIRTIRGAKLATLQGIFDEFGAALQFPWYFGENVSAFDECLSDLSWIESQAIVLVMTESDLMKNLEPSEFRWFVGALIDAKRAHEDATSRGQWERDEPAKQFIVVLQTEVSTVGQTARLWERCGATVRQLAVPSER